MTLGDDQVAMICMLRNAAYYLDVLLDHHRKLGVTHFVLIDNGSDDGTPEMAAGQSDVTVVSNRLPVRRYESLMRAGIARRVVKGGWLLFVDGDELIEMCHGEGRQLSEFTAYCNAQGYNAVVGQVLDMFGTLPLSQTRSWSYCQCVAAFDRYSLSSISHHDYHDVDHVPFWWFLKDNSIGDERITFRFGGIRREVFGENTALTTHRMLRNDPGIGIYTHAHCASNVRCADFTMLLRHYKFAGPFLARELAQVRRRVWRHGEDAQRVAVMQSCEDLVITGRDDRQFAGTATLVEEGFLVCSDRFRKMFPPPHLSGVHRRGSIAELNATGTR